MSNDTSVQVSGEHEQDTTKGSSVVTIIINDKPYEVHRGRQTVAYLKELGEVPQNYELDEVKDGRLIPLDDDGSVTIKGGEVFKSNLKIGRSS